MFRKLRTASSLSRTEWLRFMQAWFWLLFFDIGLRIRKFPELKNFATKLHSPTEQNAQIQVIIQSLKDAVERAQRNHIYPMTCLRRSLTLQKMLTSHGIASELKIGVRKEDGELQAHAWIEYQGEPIGEPEFITEMTRHFVV